MSFDNHFSDLERDFDRVTNEFMRRRAERQRQEIPPDVEVPPMDAYEEDLGPRDKDILITKLSMNDLLFPPPPPVFIIKDYLPQDVFIRNGTGGTGKSTLTLQEMLHIILGKPLWGMEILRPGPVALVTAEDDFERIRWRLFNIIQQMELTRAEKEKIVDDFYLIDLSGENERLALLDGRGNIISSTLADRIITVLKETQPVLINFDPLVKFSPGERFINDAEDAVINAAMHIRRQLTCAVGFTHHVSKVVLRDNTVDHHSGRGGSALGDGVRAAYQLLTINEGLAEKYGVANLVDAINDGSLLAYHITKLSDAKRPVDPFILRRNHWLFEPVPLTTQAEKEQQRSCAKQDRLLAQIDIVKQYLLRQVVRFTQHDLEVLHDDIGLSRNAVRTAIHKGIAMGVFVLAALPPGECRGAKKTYLKVL